MVSKGSFPFNNNKKKVNYRKVKNHRKKAYKGDSKARPSRNPSPCPCVV